MAKKESRRVKTLSSFMKWAEQFESGLYLPKFGRCCKVMLPRQKAEVNRLENSD